ncbi:hypothetical protein [Kitasatospora azatica]|uniref:hypothetical protein n=1 Tax=Kitasatospora azatica TaxID=58347 RepID=UPI00068E28F0|nr:hypothetical protein [Kitasatospora azatica]
MRPDRLDHKGRSFESLRPSSPAPCTGPCPNGCGRQLAPATVARLEYPACLECPALLAADAWTAQCRRWELLRADLGVATADMTREDLARLRHGA